MLVPRETAIARYQGRDHHLGHVIETKGGAARIHRAYDAFAAYLTPDTTVIETGEDGPGATYEALLALL